MLYRSIIGSNDPDNEPVDPRVDRVLKFVALGMIVVTVLALIYGCALNPPYEGPLLERRDVARKVVDPAGTFWESYRRMDEPQGTGFYLVDKWGYACAVLRQEFVQSDEGRSFTCQWRRPRKQW